MINDGRYVLFKSTHCSRMMCKKEVLFGGTYGGRTGGGCEWIKSESELPSTCMFLP